MDQPLLLLSLLSSSKHTCSQNNTTNKRWCHVTHIVIVKGSRDYLPFRINTTAALKKKTHTQMFFSPLISDHFKKSPVKWRVILQFEKKKIQFRISYRIYSVTEFQNGTITTIFQFSWQGLVFKSCNFFFIPFFLLIFSFLRSTSAITCSAVKGKTFNFQIHRTTLFIFCARLAFSVKVLCISIGIKRKIAVNKADTKPVKNSVETKIKHRKTLHIHSNIQTYLFPANISLY